MLLYSYTACSRLCNSKWRVRRHAVQQLQIWNLTGSTCAPSSTYGEFRTGTAPTCERWACKRPAAGILPAEDCEESKHWRALCGERHLSYSHSASASIANA